MLRQVIEKYSRATVDFLPFVDLTVNGEPVTDPADISYVVLPEHVEPDDDTEWAAAVQAGDEVGFILNGPALGRGVYHIFIRVDSNSLIPIIEAGWFRLT